MSLSFQVGLLGLLNLPCCLLLQGLTWLILQLHHLAGLFGQCEVITKSLETLMKELRPEKKNQVTRWGPEPMVEEARMLSTLLTSAPCQVLLLALFLVSEFYISQNG